jgi:hypothetical protein
VCQVRGEEVEGLIASNLSGRPRCVRELYAGVNVVRDFALSVALVHDKHTWSLGRRYL